MESYFNALREFFTVERITLFSFSSFRIIAILAGTFLVARLSGRFVRLMRSNIVEMMKRHRPGDSTFQLEKRAATIGTIIRKTMAVVIWAVAIVMILQELNFDIAPILAGVGVVGLAVGFGAQNLVQIRAETPH